MMHNTFRIQELLRNTNQHDVLTWMRRGFTRYEAALERRLLHYQIKTAFVNVLHVFAYECRIHGNVDWLAICRLRNGEGKHGNALSEIHIARIMPLVTRECSHVCLREV